MNQSDDFDPWHTHDKGQIWSPDVEVGAHLRGQDLAGGLPNDERRLVWRLLDVLAGGVLQIAVAVAAMGLLLLLFD